MCVIRAAINSLYVNGENPTKIAIAFILALHIRVTVIKRQETTDFLDTSFHLNNRPNVNKSRETEAGDVKWCLKNRYINLRIQGYEYSGLDSYYSVLKSADIS